MRHSSPVLADSQSRSCLDRSSSFSVLPLNLRPFTALASSSQSSPLRSSLSVEILSGLFICLVSSKLYCDLRFETISELTLLSKKRVKIRHNQQIFNLQVIRVDPSVSIVSLEFSSNFKQSLTLSLLSRCRFDCRLEGAATANQKLRAQLTCIRFQYSSLAPADLLRDSSEVFSHSQQFSHRH